MDPLRTFGFLLKDVSRLSSRNFERRASEVKLGLTLEQCKVLIGVQRNEGINQKRLSYLTDTDPMTLVRILDRMEKDGWIERSPDPQDRRAWLLRLTPAAEPVLKRIWAIADRARAESLAGLNAADRDLLIQLLERIRANLVALVPGATEVAPAGVADLANRPTGNDARGSSSRRVPVLARAKSSRARS